MREFQIGQYVVPVMEYLNNQVQYYIGGSWNIMSGIAGLFFPAFQDAGRWLVHSGASKALAG